MAVSAGEVAQGGAMHRRCLALARKACPVLRNDRSYVFVEVRRDDETEVWAGVLGWLAAYEDLHGQIPDLVALEQRP